MRFRVKVRDPESGEAREVAVEAPTGEEAVRAAKDRIRAETVARQAAEAERGRMSLDATGRYEAADERAAGPHLADAAPVEARPSTSDGKPKPKPAQEPARHPRLTACPDCGKDVSRRAAACPHCGCPLTGVRSATAELPLPVPLPIAPITTFIPEPTPAQYSWRPIRQSTKSDGGVGLSILLFLVGGAALVVALMMNAELDRKEKMESDINHSIGNMGASLGRYDMYKTAEKQDRVGVYAVGGVGALFLLGGLVSLGRSKK